MTTAIDLSPVLGLDEAPTPEEALREIVQRTRSLFSLPAVALEVIQLTNNLQVDARLLKECIEKDPALTAKVLRVVNSSLFGLSREVSDLNQALALLGTKPLKLLVLGFSLPEGLFVEVAREQLQWFWRTTLIRAVTAREISERLWNRPGDDAFLAGMFQDLGILVLLNHLREPYAEFLGRVIAERGQLDTLETELLGFGHTRLSAELLRAWNMPEVLVYAISEPRDCHALKHKQTAAAEVARVLHLADLLAELVGQNRLQVLPDLLEAGEAYCGFNKAQLHEIVPVLQDRVQRLAEVLSLDLPAGANYTQIIIEAHAQMAELTEDMAERLSRPPSADERAHERLLADATELRSAVSQFLRPRPKFEPKAPNKVSVPRATEAATSPAVGATAPALAMLPQTFADRLILSVGDCRSKRCPLSLMLVELKGGASGDAQDEQLVGQILENACRMVELEAKYVEEISPRRRAVILPDCERQHGVRLAHDMLRRVNRALERLAQHDDVAQRVAAAGVASVSLPPKNFAPQELLAAADRCLSAAQSSGAGVVKSLEIF